MFQYRKENAHSILYLPTKDICFVAVRMKSYFLKASLILMHHFRVPSYEEWRVRCSWSLARMPEGALVIAGSMGLQFFAYNGSICKSNIPFLWIFSFWLFTHSSNMLVCTILSCLIGNVFWQSKFWGLTAWSISGIRNQAAWQVSLPASVSAHPHPAIANTTPLAVFLLCHATKSFVCELFY